MIYSGNQPKYHRYYYNKCAVPFLHGRNYAVFGRKLRSPWWFFVSGRDELPICCHGAVVQVLLRGHDAHEQETVGLGHRGLLGAGHQHPSVLLLHHHHPTSTSAAARATARPPLVTRFLQLSGPGQDEPGRQCEPNYQTQQHTEPRSATSACHFSLYSKLRISQGFYFFVPSVRFKRHPLLQSRPEHWVWVRAWSPLITVHCRCVRCSAPVPIYHQPLPSNHQLSAPREPWSGSWRYFRRLEPESEISQGKLTVCCLKKCGCILVLETISPLWVSASAWNASAATRLNRQGFLTRWRRRSSFLIGWG